MIHTIDINTMTAESSSESSDSESESEGRSLELLAPRPVSGGIPFTGLIALRFRSRDFFVGVVKSSDSVCPDSSGGGGSLELLAPSSGDCASSSLLLIDLE
jgi:hypothetical protein